MPPRLQQMAPEARQAGDPFACMHGHSAPVHGIDWMPDGRSFLTASSDGTLRIWSPELQRNLAVYRYIRLPSSLLLCR